MTWVNQIHYGYDELPFGGVKASGFGKEHGLEALDSYVEHQVGRRRGSRLMAVQFESDQGRRRSRSITRRRTPMT